MGKKNLWVVLFFLVMICFSFPAFASQATPSDTAPLESEAFEADWEDLELINDLTGGSVSLSQEEISSIRNALETCMRLLIFVDAFLALLFGCLLVVILCLFLK